MIKGNGSGTFYVGMLFDAKQFFSMYTDVF